MNLLSLYKLNELKFKRLKNFILLIIGLLIIFPVSSYSQDHIFLAGDSLVVISDINLQETDSLSITTDEIADTKKNSDTFVPDPGKAVLYSAIFPGLGQIYNRKYWKLPIIYGGAIGCVYAITWNHKVYTGYKNAYRDVMDNDDSTDSWKDYINSDVPSEYLINTLKRRRDNFRRYRDLSCIIAIGIYAVCMVDSYVDAQLFEFDISEDLSMRIDPVIFQRTASNAQSFGFQCSFSF